MDYREALDYIYGHSNYEAVPRPHAEDYYDLRRVFEILEILGNPHLKAKSLHITGTNGKGSTSAMLASVLSEAGYTTGLYTSPHLVTTRERFTVNGRMISEPEVARLTDLLRPEIEAVNQRATYGRLTVFEILTVLCFLYFNEEKCQFQVMEVGMGGRFDATNVIQPEVCFLTSISFDHTAILGNTLTQIATEKCGIIKPGCVVVSHPQAEEAYNIVQKTCLDQGVNLIEVGKDIKCKSLSYDFGRQEFEIQGRLDKYQVSIPLLGRYQMDNAAAALAGLEVLIERGYHISREDILRGLARVDFPGRMQIIERHPLIVMDGGHNPAAAHSLKEALLQYFKPAKSILVIGISSDKDLAGIVQELAPIFDIVIATRANSPRSTKPEIIAAEFQKYGLETRVSENIPQSLSEAKGLASDNDLICVAGSLYVVGDALAHLKGYTPNS